MNQKHDVLAKMTDEEWQNLYDNFETTWLLDAVGHIDEARHHLGDGEHLEPPQIRKDLLELHQLAMDIINNGWKDEAEELFNKTSDLEMQVSDIIEALESVQMTLNKLTELYPESMIYASSEEAK